MVQGPRDWTLAGRRHRFFVSPARRQHVKTACGVEKNGGANSSLAHFESLSLAPSNPSEEVETASSSLTTTVVVSTMQAAGEVVADKGPNGQTTGMREHKRGRGGMQARGFHNIVPGSTATPLVSRAAAVAM